MLLELVVLINTALGAFNMAALLGFKLDTETYFACRNIHIKLANNSDLKTSEHDDHYRMHYISRA